MATTKEYVTYVCDQIAGTGDIRYRAMFGEYMVYVNDKPVLTLCDNTVFVKKLKQVEEIMKDASVGFPYEGAKEAYILDIENADFAKQVVTILEKVVPVPKKRTKKA